MNYEAIKELAKELGVSFLELIALSNHNDPFYCGTETKIKQAHWFADLWEHFGYGEGTHLRRIHYQLISQNTPVKTTDGTPYENTEKCWDSILGASRFARILGLVNPRAFVDRRNPEPRIFTEHSDEGPGYRAYAALAINDSWEFELPSFPSRPSLTLFGEEDLNPYHLEIWCEKSTMNDVLIPLCEEREINLVTGLGFMSITSALNLLDRVAGAQRPARIFYISDFDPSGKNMPVAVARQVEFWNSEGSDICLNMNVLTLDQVRDYKLPRSPIKESDRGKAGFEDRYGEGAVELDALEALHPGELRRILSREIVRYADVEVIRRSKEANREFRSKIRKAEGKALSDLDPQWADLKIEYEDLMSEVERGFEKINERRYLLSGKIRERLLKVAEGLDETTLDVSLSDDEPDYLFDSQREYLDQMRYYKAHQGKDINW